MKKNVQEYLIPLNIILDLNRFRNNRFDIISLSEKQDGEQKNEKKDIKIAQILFLLF